MKPTTLFLALTLILTLLSPSLCTPFASLPTLERADDASPEPSMDLEPSPSASPDDDDEVCVSEAYLLSLGHTRRDLVHPHGIVATALCPRDSSLPCGTKHHLLRVDGHSLSYAQLCEKMVCDTRIEKVNSVYSHVWTEKLVDQGVHLTMFDARYHELPQKALHWAMRTVRRVV